MTVESPLRWERRQKHLKMANLAKTGIEIEFLRHPPPTTAILPPEPIYDEGKEHPNAQAERE